MYHTTLNFCFSQRGVGKAYYIIYEDGDSEDMTAAECRACIELYSKLESGEINEWEIGGDE